MCMCECVCVAICVCVHVWGVQYVCGPVYMCESICGVWV